MASVNSSAVLDTHPLVYWLLDPDKLSRKVRDILSRPASRIHIPTVVLLEFQYLIEIGRIEASIRDVMAAINETPQFTMTSFDIPALTRSLQLSGTRDPFDRMILATAEAYDWPMITRDRWMREQLGKRAVW